MARTFTDAHEALSDLIGRYEKNPAAQALRSYAADPGEFGSVHDFDHFQRMMGDAATAGAIEIRRVDRSPDSPIKFISLRGAAELYLFLNREPAPVAARKAFDRALTGLAPDPALANTLDGVLSRWSAGRKYRGLGCGQVDELRAAVQLAQALYRGEHEGLEYRTFSRRQVGRSKALEELEAVVVQILVSANACPAGLRPRDALDAIGLKRFRPPMLISGPVSLNEVDLRRLNESFVGLAAESGVKLRLTEPPSYVLTIENQASFERHATEINSGLDALVIFTGGFPSKPVQEAIRNLTAGLPPELEIFHWSDLDPAGLKILEVVSGLIPSVRPHLMSPADYGLSEDVAFNGTIADFIRDALAALARCSADFLEQEELDPRSPLLATRVRSPVSVRVASCRQRFERS
jgi:hypothetical protein